MIRKKTLTFLFVKLWLVVAMLLSGRALYDKLPEQMPTHRNIQGQVDAYWSKLSGIITLPLIVLAMVFLFLFLPKIDPKKANYPKFSRAWEILQFIIIGFMVYIYGVSLFVTLYPQYPINTLMLAWLGIMFLLMGNYMGKIRHNFFVWIKTPWTIADETVWNKTHRLSWWLWVLGWLLFLLQAFILQYVAATFIIILIILVLVPMIYSYILFKRYNK